MAGYTHNIFGLKQGPNVPCAPENFWTFSFPCAFSVFPFLILTFASSVVASLQDFVWFLWNVTFWYCYLNNKCIPLVFSSSVKFVSPCFLLKNFHRSDNSKSCKSCFIVFPLIKDKYNVRNSIRIMVLDLLGAKFYEQKNKALLYVVLLSAALISRHL